MHTCLPMCIHLVRFTNNFIGTEFSINYAILVQAIGIYELLHIFMCVNVFTLINVYLHIYCICIYINIYLL